MENFSSQNHEGEISPIGGDISPSSCVQGMKEGTKVIVNNIMDTSVLSSKNRLQPRLANKEDIQHWFLFLGGDVIFQEILSSPPSKRSAKFQYLIRGWNSDLNKEFSLPETSDGFYKEVTEKEGIGMRRKFGEIYDTLSGNIFNTWYLQSDDLKVWYKTPDEFNKTGRDYLFEAISQGFCSSWKTIAKGINKERKEKNLGLIHESHQGFKRCIAKSDIISDMLIAFGEDPSQIPHIIGGLKDSVLFKVPEGIPTKEDIKIWFAEKGGKIFIENLLGTKPEHRAFRFKRYYQASRRGEIQELKDVAYGFPEKITDLCKIVTGRDYSGGRIDPLQEIYNLLLTGSESGRFMTSEELKQWYNNEGDDTIRSGKSIILEAIEKGFFHGWKTIAEKENIKRKELGLPLIHTSANGIMKSIIKNNKINLTNFIILIRKSEIPLKTEDIEILLTDFSRITRIYFTLFLKGIERIGVPKEWFNTENICFLKGNQEGTVLISHIIIKFIGKKELIDIANKASESGNKITEHMLGGGDFQFFIEEMKNDLK